MSTWAYCDNCNLPIPFPTVVDAIIGEQECANCNHIYKLENYTRRPLIQEFVDALIPAASEPV